MLFILMALERRRLSAVRRIGFLEKPPRRADHRLRLITVRRVAATGQLQGFKPADPAPHPLQLLHRPILVLITLHGEHRN